MSRAHHIFSKTVSLEALGGIPSGADNMHPGHRFVQRLVVSQLAPGAIAHAIIAVQGRAPRRPATMGWWYESARLDGVASEKVVRSSHCTRREPDTIQEARRILREHMLDTAVKPGTSVAQSR